MRKRRGLRGAGGAGFCEADGWCSFLDLSCESGRRYGEFAEPAGQCVDPDGPDGATGGTGEPVAGDEHGAPGSGPGPGGESSTEGSGDPIDHGSDDSGESSGGSPGDSDDCGAGPSVVDFGDFGIDHTEVTKCQYAAFLAGAVPLQTQPGVCSWNLDFEPEGFFPLTHEELGQPVVGVDWCDAWAYCAWAGKRLCGSTSGGPATFGDVRASDDAWYYACSHGGATAFAYGDNYDPTACVGAGYDGDPEVTPADAPMKVGSAAGCVGLYPPHESVHDLTGNVVEWVDACEAGGDPTQNLCHRRGGAYKHTAADVACHDDSHSARETRSPAIGIRCCTL